MFNFLLAAHHATGHCHHKPNIICRRLADAILAYAPFLDDQAHREARAFLDLANTFPPWPHDLDQLTQLTLADPEILTAIRRAFEKRRNLCFPGINAAVTAHPDHLH